ncbi:DUF6221 family protein [Streptomyces olivochromogenes]|uniref:Uncharacterized protein n=1 Tax=Streptomyces olivochromogenes TaxID=1963 RepID=A0A250VT85_STROL|nr:DUF6221 family protein [Streptomyces olivochromogenes]KUN38253.1 hypothetical protein AQJ27_44945 [Streptomyces olivochromogenes]GAX57306.1 hypothetical protein SO3561_08876 [Streptomyces olivochromogenes]
MNEIADFLRARLAEDAARQQDVWEESHHRDCESLPDVLHPNNETGACNCGLPARVLADVEAKLALIDHMVGMLTAAEGDTEVDHYGALDAAEKTLCLLAQPFAGHPDHKGEEWTP